MFTDFFDKSYYEWIAYALLLTGFVLALAIQFGLYFKLIFLKEPKEVPEEQPVSILLIVRNEEERIEKLLMKLLEQEYSDFEIIVVDNFSEDNTLTIVGALARRYPRLKFSALSQELRFSEKMAVNIALKAARHDWVIFLSPETGDISPMFLKKINNEIRDDYSIALNYLNYAHEKDFFSRWCRIERFYCFLTSAAYSLSGLLLFFQQNNVAFRKQIYFESAGFKGRMNDDFANMELLFHKKKGKVVVSVDRETGLTEELSQERNELAELVRKRIQIRKNLSWIKRMILGLEDSSVLLLLSGFVWLLIRETKYWYVYTIPVVVVVGVHLIIVKSLLNRLKEKKIFLSSFIYLLVRPVISGYSRAALAIHMQRNRWI
jgi:glycosyltransferase involved in cell wall biosynthesis